MIDDDTQYDFQMINTASVIVGTDREDVLTRIQRVWAPIQPVWQIKERWYQLFGLWNIADLADLEENMIYNMVED